MKTPSKTLKLLAAGLVFLLGGLVPLTRGAPINTILLLLAAVFGVVALIAAATARRSRESSPPAA